MKCSALIADLEAKLENCAKEARHAEATHADGAVQHPEPFLTEKECADLRAFMQSKPTIFL